jgi:murein DD-endopeptidase MepM/ murein hydrolase activator NlpD
MAVAVKPSKSLLNIRSGIKSIKDSFSGLRKNAGNLNDVVLKKTKVKRESIVRNAILSQRRQEQERRKNKEDLLEASTIGGAVKRQAKAVASSTKGFLGRIMDFLATLLVGWLLTNLPSIITMAQELIARIQRLYTIVTGFFDNTIKLFRGFGSLLSAVGKNILTFDFMDSKGRVESSLKDLGGTFEDMQSQFDEGFRLLTTSLGEGVVSGEDAQPFGTQYENESMQQQPSGGTSGGGRWKPILDVIAGGESTTSGDYDAMYPGRNTRKEGRPVSEMTITESAKYAGDRFDGKGNYAVGRYQFTTVMSQAKSAGLNPDKDLFSPANQDKMAVKIIEGKRRGRDWLSGKITDEQFGILLANEWAALKRPSGTGSYDGDGRNKATIGWGNVKAALSQVKSTPQQAQVAAPSPAQTTSAPTLAAINPNKRIAKGTKVGDTIKTDFFGSMSVGRKTPHGGIDLGCDIGTYISCKYPCKVVEARYQDGYGYYTDIIIPSLNIRLRFAHLSSQLVKSGDVPAGKPFARSGNSGSRTTGPHIHMEATRKMGGTAYGGDFNPDPYVDVMIFSKKPPQGFVAPAIPSANITPPAQITSSGTQQRQQASQQLARQPSGPSIIIIEEEPPAPQPQGSIGGGGAMMIPLIINPLNSFITKKLLLDLAYT